MAQTEERASTEDHPHAGLALAHRLLGNEGQNRLDLSPFLRELAGVFRAEGAGLLETSGDSRVTRERLTGGVPPLPWQETPTLLATAVRSLAPLLASHEGHHYLVGPAGPQHFLWLESATAKEASKEEEAKSEEKEASSSSPHSPSPHSSLSAWGPVEAAALGVVAQALARRLDIDLTGGTLAEEQRLEDAVLVSRRLAHVYSNVLTSILGFLEMSLTQVQANSTLKRYLDIALRGAQQGVHLTERLRLLGCKATASATGTPLLPALSHQLGKRAAPGRDVEEILDIADDLPLLALSSEQLSAILNAVLDNAHEAIEQKGRILIAARVVVPRLEEISQVWGRMKAGTYVRLEISDSGVGLGAEARLRLFRQPFFTTKPRHHGLGLLIVHSIVSSQQGGVCLLDNPAGGLTVQVFLPVHTASATGDGTERRGQP